MPTRRLPNWLQAYSHFTQITESPDQFNYWVGVWTVAGALRRKVFIEMGHFQWIPNFYLFLVSPPGIVSKSTCLNIGASLLKEMPGIAFGPESLTWQALVQSLSKAREETPMLIDGEPGFFPMSCLSIAAGELGTLIEPKNREMIDALVSLWDGRIGAWEKWTKTSGNDMIINPYINIASATTPSWIAQNFPEELIGGGFTSRCIFVHAEKKKRLIAYPKEELPADFAKLRLDLIHDLEIISALNGPFTLTPGAFEYGKQWYEDHYNEKASPELERFSGYRARKQTHIHKVAMVLSASHRDDLVITQEILKEANVLVTALEASMKKVFENIGLEGAGRRLSFLMQGIGPYGQMPKDSLFSRVAFKMSSEEFDQAVIAGVRSGLLRIFANGTNVYVKNLGSAEHGDTDGTHSIGS